MTSVSMRQKIAKARAAAPSELPKARLCAKVILAALEGQESMKHAVAELKKGVGNNWSHTLAFQFMSGMRGEFAADCAEPDEQDQLHLARLLAKHVCEQEKLGVVVSPNGLDVTILRALALSVKADDMLR